MARSPEPRFCREWGASKSVQQRYRHSPVALICVTFEQPETPWIRQSCSPAHLPRSRSHHGAHHRVARSYATRRSGRRCTRASTCRSHRSTRPSQTFLRPSPGLITREPTTLQAFATSISHSTAAHAGRWDQHPLWPIGGISPRARKSCHRSCCQCSTFSLTVAAAARRRQKKRAVATAWIAVTCLHL